MDYDKKELEEFFGTEEKILSQKNACEKSIAAIEIKLKNLNPNSKHNSILVIKSQDNEITHIIDPERKKGLIMIEAINEQLAVPRYTPQVARKWLDDEDIKLTGGDEDIRITMRKSIVLEKDFSLAVLDNLKVRAEYFNNILIAFEKVS